MRRPGARRTDFAQFASDHGDELVRFAFAISGDHERAQDAVQEALTRVYQRWAHLENPLMYARRAVVTATRDDWRRGVRQGRVRDRIAGLPAPAADDPQERFLERDLLLRAMGELTHHQRAVLLLRYRLGLSEAETALTLGIAVGTVKSQTSRALARLREVLARAGAGAGDTRDTTQTMEAAR